MTSQQTNKLQLECLKNLPQNSQLHKAWHGYTRIAHSLDSGRIVCLDGGVGSEVQKRNLDTEQSLQWFGYPSQLYNPDGVRSIHEDFAKAGAEILVANTYASNIMVMSNERLQNKCEVTDELVRHANIAAIRIAREAASSYSSLDHPVYIAGSISTHPPSVPPSEIQKVGYSKTDLGQWPSEEQEYSSYLSQAQALRDAEADFIFMEMLKDKDHALRALQAASTTRLPIFAGLTLTLNEKNEAVLRDDPSVSLKQAVDVCSNITGVVGINIMHCDADNMEQFINQLRQNWSGLIGCYPELGKLDFPKWTTSVQMSPEGFVEYAKRWRSSGANMIGGCCGFDPAHICALSKWIESETKPTHKWNLTEWLASPTIPEWLHMPHLPFTESTSVSTSASEVPASKKGICAGAGCCGETEEKS